jgi:branched-chain amino acid transport system permease protein
MHDLAQQIVNGLILGGVYSVSGTGFAITYGISRILNFAHGIFFAAGGFALYWLTEQIGMPVLLGLALTGLAVVPLALVAYVLVIRPFPPARATAALVGTFGLSMIMIEVFQIVWGSSPLFPERIMHGKPLRVGGVFVSRDNVVLTTLAVLVVATVGVVWRWSGVGRRMRALVQSRDAAMLLGINPEPHRLAAFVWGSVLASIAGSFFAIQTVIDASTATRATFVAFAVVIVAGLGNITGAAIVGFGMGVLEAVTTLYVRAEYTVAAPFAVMIVVLLLKPQGLFPRKV